MTAVRRHKATGASSELLAVLPAAERMRAVVATRLRSDPGKYLAFLTVDGHEAQTKVRSCCPRR